LARAAQVQVDPSDAFLPEHVISVTVVDAVVAAVVATVVPVGVVVAPGSADVVSPVVAASSVVVVTTVVVVVVVVAPVVVVVAAVGATSHHRPNVPRPRAVVPSGQLGMQRLFRRYLEFLQKVHTVAVRTDPST
jgi:hypothetical protein